MQKVFIIGTANKKIPYKGIFKEIPSKNIYLSLPYKKYSENDLKNFKNQYGKIFTYDDQQLNLEWFCYETYQSMPYDRLIANLEMDILWSGRIRDLLSLRGQSYESALLFRDKYIMKKHVLKNGFQTPAFKKIESEGDFLDFIMKERFPIIVKPIRGSASEGIHIIKSFEEAKEFSKNNLSLQHEANFLAESYVSGNFYQIDGYVKDGKMVFAWPSATIQKCLDICSGIPVGRYFLSPQHPLLKKLLEYTKNIIECFPTGDAMVFHLECFYENNDFIFCEIASRSGGARGRETWIESFGIDLGAEAMRAQAGLSLNITENLKLQPKNISGFLIFPKQNGFLKKIPLNCPTPGVIEYTIFVKKNEQYQKAQGLRDIACIVVLSAPSEQIFLERIQNTLCWYNNTYYWSKCD